MNYFDYSTSNEDAMNQLVIQLHNIARDVESLYGVCELSLATRKLADRYANLISPLVEV